MHAMINSSETVLSTTSSLCSHCKVSVPAQVVSRAEQVFLKKSCAIHGPQEVLISSSLVWYQQLMQTQPRLTPPVPRKEVSQGCPFDCGPCTQHQQNIQLPIVPITSACNLDCPICYTHNKNEGAWHMTEDNLRSILMHLRTASPERRIINLTGGEPTQHPLFERLVQLCKEEGIHRITISTHGLRFLKEEGLLERLAEIDARIVLSFDSFRKQQNRELLGGDLLSGKLRVLALLEKYSVSTTLLPVLARGYNDDEVAEFVALALSKDFIRSVELHTMTFTGQSGTKFDRQGRYTPYDVLCDLERYSQGRIRVTDFVPSPAAHPLCYQVNYLLGVGQDQWLPFLRFMKPDEVYALLGNALYMESGPEQEEVLRDVMTRLWAEEEPGVDSAAVLGVLKQMILDASEQGDGSLRLRRAERHTKAIYLHSHMDEETFDTDRIRMCPVGIREPDGSNIPSCAYNVLYRERDGRFMKEPAGRLVTLGRGRT